MNKKGFTLIELIAVLLILALMSIMVLPNLLDIFHSKKSDVTDKNKDIIVETARYYIESNAALYPETFGNVYCIPLDYLITEGILKEELIDGTIYEEINGVIEAKYNGNVFYLNLKEKSECRELKK